MDIYDLKLKLYKIIQIFFAIYLLTFYGIGSFPIFFIDFKIWFQGSYQKLFGFAIIITYILYYIFSLGVSSISRINFDETNNFIIFLKRYFIFTTIFGICSLFSLPFQDSMDWNYILMSVIVCINIIFSLLLIFNIINIDDFEDGDIENGNIEPLHGQYQGGKS